MLRWYIGGQYLQVPALCTIISIPFTIDKEVCMRLYNVSGALMQQDCYYNYSLQMHAYYYVQLQLRIYIYMEKECTITTKVIHRF